MRGLNVMDLPQSARSAATGSFKALNPVITALESAAAVDVFLTLAILAQVPLLSVHTSQAAAMESDN